MSNKGVLASEYPQKNCPVANNVLVKDFARWYCKSCSGRLAPRPNLKSVKNILKKFRSANFVASPISGAHFGQFLESIFRREAVLGSKTPGRSSMARERSCLNACHDMECLQWQVSKRRETKPPSKRLGIMRQTFRSRLFRSSWQRRGWRGGLEARNSPANTHSPAPTILQHLPFSSAYHSPATTILQPIPVLLERPVLVRNLRLKFS
jgi:hypothetical protein